MKNVLLQKIFWIGGFLEKEATCEILPNRVHFWALHLHLLHHPELHPKFTRNQVCDLRNTKMQFCSKIKILRNLLGSSWLLPTKLVAWKTCSSSVTYLFVSKNFICMFVNITECLFSIVPHAQYQKLKNVNQSTRAAVPLKSSSKRVSCWFVGFFFISVLNKGDQLKEPSSITYLRFQASHHFPKYHIVSEGP